MLKTVIEFGFVFQLDACCTIGLVNNYTLQIWTPKQPHPNSLEGVCHYIAAETAVCLTCRDAAKQPDRHMLHDYTEVVTATPMELKCHH